MSQTVRLIKSNIARRLNALDGASGAVWQEGFFDRVPRGIDDLNMMIEYIENNPVKARFVNGAGEYEFSSARGDCIDAYRAYLNDERNGYASETAAAHQARLVVGPDVSNDAGQEPALPDNGNPSRTSGDAGQEPALRDNKKLDASSTTRRDRWLA